MTTFITPFEIITSALEYFQKRVSEILQGVDGVVCLIDDNLVHGKTQEEHDKCLTVVLQKTAAAGVTLNKDKCEFSK